MKPEPELAWAWLGRVAYRPAWRLQEELRQRIVTGHGAEALLMLEHDPVITLGRHANRDHLLSSPETLQRLGIEVVASTRGGDVTYHGPGQLVGYPVVHVRWAVPEYLERLGAALREVLAPLGIEAAWRPEPAGLWVGERKIAAVGLHLHRGVAIHGFALNVTTPLTEFAHIVPCGLSHAGVTSVSTLSPEVPVTPASLAPQVAAAVATHLQRRAMAVPADALWSVMASPGPREP